MANDAALCYSVGMMKTNDTAATPSPLNLWQRRVMRAAALSFRRAYPVPSVIFRAIVAREMSFTARPLHEKRARIKRGTARALQRFAGMFEKIENGTARLSDMPRGLMN